MEELYAIVYHDNYMTDYRGTGTRTYRSAENAERQVLKHWPGVVRAGYSIVKLTPEVVKTVEGENNA